MRLLTFLCLLFSAQLIGQTCYQRISDQSGYQPTTGQLAQLEQAACTLLDSLPIAQRDSFGIFEVGFYLHNTVTHGGIPEAFQMAIDAAKQRKPYYILFGKQSDATGLYTRFWVDLELPLGGEFSCLNLISPSQGLRSDLEFKYQYQVNTEYTKLGTEPSVYATAISTTLDSLTARIHEIKECCDNQQKGAAGCGACVSTPEEIAQFFRDKGYVAIPIKILTPVSLKPDSLGAKPSAPGVDVCTDITSIEIDGTVCNDFPTVISNIVAEWPGGPAQAVITDNECMCEGGLESVYTTKHDQIPDGFKLHIWRNHNRSENDLIFSRTIFREQLGVFPFHGYLPIHTNAEKYSTRWDKAAVKEIVQGIYSKNGFQLSSFEWNEPNLPLKPLDLYNKLQDNESQYPCSGIGGTSIVDFEHSTTTDNSVIDAYKLFNGQPCGRNPSRNTMNYWAGYVIAHEYLHQMLLQYISHIANHSNNGSILNANLISWTNDGNYLSQSTDGHCATIKNLLFPGDGMHSGEVYKLIMNKDVPIGSSASDRNTINFIPSSWSSVFSDWELIVPNHKLVLATGYLSNTVYNKFGFHSCESKLIHNVACDELLKLKFERAHN